LLSASLTIITNTIITTLKRSRSNCAKRVPAAAEPEVDQRLGFAGC